MRIFLLVWYFDIGPNLFLFEYVFFTHISAVFFCNSGKSYNVVTEKGDADAKLLFNLSFKLFKFSSKYSQSQIQLFK